MLVNYFRFINMIFTVTLARIHSGKAVSLYKNGT